MNTAEAESLLETLKLSRLTDIVQRVKKMAARRQDILDAGCPLALLQEYNVLTLLLAQDAAEMVNDRQKGEFVSRDVVRRLEAAVNDAVDKIDRLESLVTRMYLEAK